jgi:hypothetical protein
MMYAPPTYKPPSLVLCEVRASHHFFNFYQPGITREKIRADLYAQKYPSAMGFIRIGLVLNSALHVSLSP